jgi:hypothetical protein
MSMLFPPSSWIILMYDGVGVRDMLSVLQDLLCKKRRSESTRHLCVSLYS